MRLQENRARVVSSEGIWALRHHVCDRSVSQQNQTCGRWMFHRKKQRNSMKIHEKILNKMHMYLTIYTYTGLWGMQYTTLRQAAWWNNGCGFDRRLGAHDNDERPIMQAVFCGISRICKNFKLDRLPMPIYLQLHIDVATHEGSLGQLTWKLFRSNGRVPRSFIPSSKERSRLNFAKWYLEA